MRLKKLRARIARIVVAAVCALGLTLAVSAAVPASAAVPPPPDTCTPSPMNGQYWVHYGCGSQEIDASHVCQAFDNGEYVDGIQAIECADIYVTTTGGDNIFWGEGEFYCQGPNGYVQCAGMNVHIQVTVNGQTDGNKNYVCNPSAGACPTDGRAKWSSMKFGTIYAGKLCWPVTGKLPSDNVIAVKSGYAALHSTDEVDTPTLTVCDTPIGS